MGVIILCVICAGIFLIMRAGDNVFGELFSLTIIFVLGTTVVVGSLIVLGAVLIPAALTLAAIWFCCKAAIKSIFCIPEEELRPGALPQKP